RTGASWEARDIRGVELRGFADADSSFRRYALQLHVDELPAVPRGAMLQAAAHPARVRPCLYCGCILASQGCRGGRATSAPHTVARRRICSVRSAHCPSYRALRNHTYPSVGAESCQICASCGWLFNLRPRIVCLISIQHTCRENYFMS